MKPTNPAMPPSDPSHAATSWSTEAPPDAKADWIRFGVIALALAVTRYPLWNLAAKESDVAYYATRYVDPYRLAEANRRGFYELREELMEGLRQRQYAKTAFPLSEKSRYVDYPPLAIAAMLIPSWAIDNGIISENAVLLYQYRRAFRCQLALVDAVVFVLLASCIGRWFGHESVWSRTERIVLYLVASGVLAYLLYDRLDLLVGLALLGSTALLVLPGRRWLALIALAATTSLKLAPGVLAPLWAMGTLPAHGPETTNGWRRDLGPILLRLLVFALATVACFAPFVLIAGPRTLGFFAYHATRGVEVGSTGATIAFLLDRVGIPATVFYEHGSFNVRSSALPLVQVFVSLVGVAAFLWVLRQLYRLPSSPPVTAERPTESQAASTRAEVHSGPYLNAVIVLLLVSLAASPVLSPQYLLWIVPLVPLVSAGPLCRRIFQWGFVVLCATTTAIFPLAFWDHIVRPAVDGAGLPTFLGPTSLGTALLALRAAVLVALATFGVLWFRQRA